LSSLPPHRAEFRRVLDFIEGLEDYIERVGLDPWEKRIVGRRLLSIGERLVGISIEHPKLEVLTPSDAAVFEPWLKCREFWYKDRSPDWVIMEIAHFLNENNAFGRKVPWEILEEIATHIELHVYMELEEFMKAREVIRRIGLSIILDEHKPSLEKGDAVLVLDDYRPLLCIVIGHPEPQVD